MLKVTVIKSKLDKEIEFPCLMISRDGDILLAVDESRDNGDIEGTIVRVDDKGKTKHLYLGEYNSVWHQSSFVPFYGKVILEQK